MKLENIYKYKYKHINSYKEKPNLHHDGNFKGEIYEYFCIELLLKRFENNSAVKIIAKGPYLDSATKREGFSYNKDKEIYYFSDSETIAEFDFLAFYEDRVDLYEISNSKISKQITSLSEIIRKKTLLKLAFGLEVKVNLISSKKIDKPQYIDHYEMIDFPSVDIDLAKFNPKKIINQKISFMDITTVVQNKTYNHFDIVRKNYEIYKKKKSLEKYYETTINEYPGLLERLFLGKDKNSILYIQINDDNLEVRKIEKNKKVFIEISESSRKKVSSSKRVLKEIKILSEILKEIEEKKKIVKKLEQLCLTHNKLLKQSSLLS